MLTFEWDEQLDQLQVHADVHGLKALARIITNLASRNGLDHIHLMTTEWGGDDLSSERQNCSALLINHVKIFKWGK